MRGEFFGIVGLGKLARFMEMRVIFLTMLMGVGVSVGQVTPVYVGTGADGIYLLSLDEKTGAMTGVKQVVKGQGLEFQWLSRDGGMIFSTIRKEGKGGVASYRIEGGEFTEISVQNYEGRGLCHVSLDAEEKVLFGADYGGGLVVSFPVKEGKIGEVASVMKHEGSSVNEKRQRGPHAHSFYAGPGNEYAYAPDLGIDRVMIYGFDGEGKLTAAGGAEVPPGSGPRHLKFGKDGRFAYVLNELTLTVSVLRREAATGALSLVETVSVLPEGMSGEEMTCSEILVSKDGKFLYTANRDLTEAGRDSLSVMSVAEDGTIGHLETSPAGVWIPRNINLSPTGDWLLVAGQKSNEVTSHRVDRETGKLTYSGKRAEVPVAMCLNFGR